jgi:hypothetical protein
MSWRYKVLSVALACVAIIVSLGIWFGEWFALGCGIAGVLAGHISLTSHARRQRTCSDAAAVEDILTRFPGPVVLAPSRFHSVSRLVVIVVAGATATWALVIMDGVVTTILLAAFIAMLVSVGVFLFIKTQPRLTALCLTDTDFEIRNIRSHRVRWSDSSEFVVAPAPAPMIVFDDQGRKDSLPPVKAWGGRNSVVPNHSPLTLADLALVMNRWRMRVLASQEGPQPR